MEKTFIAIIVNDKYANDNIKDIIRKANLSKHPNVKILVNSNFDIDYSKGNEGVINCSKKHRGTVEGFNQAFSYSQEQYGNYSHIIFIDEHSHIVDGFLDKLMNEELKDDEIYTAKYFHIKRESQFVYNDDCLFKLKYRNVTGIDYFDIDRDSFRFNTSFVVIPMHILKEINLPNFLYTFIGCNYVEIFKDHKVNSLQTIYCEDKQYETKLNPKDIYYFYRNSLVICSLFDIHFNVNSIIKDIEEEFNAGLLLYRYSDIKAMLLGILDYFKGPLFLSSIDVEYLDCSLSRLNYYLWTSNELDTFFTWKEWEKTRERIDEESLKKNLENKGYIDENALEFSVVEMYDQVSFTTFNTQKILHWDIDGEVGFVTRRNDEEINFCIKLLEQIKQAFKNNQVIQYKDIKLPKRCKNKQYHHALCEENWKYYQEVLDERSKEQEKWSNLPIDNNQVFFSVGTRLGFCDNPKYVLLDLIKKKPNLNIIWSAHKVDLCDDIKNLGVKVINMHDEEEFMRYLYTSKVIVYNDNLPISFVPRKGQILINTWHGAINYKNIGLKGERFANEVDKKLFMLANPLPRYFVAGSKTFLKDTAKSFKYPRFRFVKSGLPRNDILFNKSNINLDELKNKLGVEQSKKVCLYAPTFRNDNVASIHGIDIHGLLEILTKRFGGDWALLYRGHPFTVNFWTKGEFIDVTNYPDQQEILLISDVVISDYSSMMWDASLLDIPVFCYAPDYYEYLKFERGFAYKIEQFPFKIALTNEELANSILDFDKDQYLSLIKAHHKKEGSYDKGLASQRISKIIIKKTK